MRHSRAEVLKAARSLNPSAIRAVDSGSYTVSEGTRGTRLEYRCVVRVSGASVAVHVSPWGSKEWAERAANNHRAMIRDRGWTHTVEVQAREVSS